MPLEDSSLKPEWEAEAGSESPLVWNCLQALAASLESKEISAEAEEAAQVHRIPPSTQKETQRHSLAL